MSFKLYLILNEYKQEVDAAVKSTLLSYVSTGEIVLRFVLQRSPIYHMFNVLVCYAVPMVIVIISPYAFKGFEYF